MKRCPRCQQTYSDTSLNFCLDDGTPLIADAAPPSDPHATVRYPDPRDTSEPPPTEIYHQPQSAPVLNQVPELGQPQQWSPPPRSGPPSIPPRQKSNAIWWVLGGLATFAVIGIGLVVMIIALASIGGSEADGNVNLGDNSNVRVTNRNSSVNVNRTSSTSTGTLTDDFSQNSWDTGNSQFGEIWYEDGEYHMRAKEKMYVVMYGPNNRYSTENATVRVTVRNVDSSSAPSGYGLIVHGELKNRQLEDYAFLIDNAESPKYQVVMHKNGNQTPVISWTPSTVIRPGTSPNQLEARIDGSEISFYINGQFVNRITDSENFRKGLAGFYTSGTTEVAFDDLEIRR